MEHVVVVVGLSKEETEYGAFCSVFGRVDVFKDGVRNVTVGLEVEEVLGPKRLVVRPPGGEDPGVSSSLDKVFGDLQGCGG